MMLLYVFYHVFLKFWIVNWCETNTPITQITIIWRKLHFLLELSIVPERLRIRLGRFLLHDQHEDVENVAPSHVSHDPGTHLQKPKFWVKGSTLFFVSSWSQKSYWLFWFGLCYQFDTDRLAAQKISSVIEIVHLLYNSISLTQIDHIKRCYWTHLNDATAASANLFDAQSAQIAETHSSCSRNKWNAS